ncbi:hypothetical protein SAMN05421771_4064 [Granulicella pectinivorans]|jgi:hypothetical protein|uniref:Uncharacterized protein n=1 Tax=Granulicella pectinivorans TaxID=474950 RepID=A0A1I6MZU3_9BACT|nr:hypothetical protein [Granulicella pectinivorans]SFS21157.1 hypothetical protein SAMN05421771_4064 [Granulicella pectinivorans]
MANRYGEAALMAVRMETYGKQITPGERWAQATKTLYPTSEKAQRKTAPKGAFLGLCDAGLVKGIPAGKYGATRDNANYAIAASALLVAGTHTSVSSLWAAVTNGDGTEHQSQMDVVMALWKNGLIVKPATTPKVTPDSKE